MALFPHSPDMPNPCFLTSNPMTLMCAAASASVSVTQANPPQSMAALCSPACAAECASYAGLAWSGQDWHREGASRSLGEALSTPAQTLPEHASAQWRTHRAVKSMGALARSLALPPDVLSDILRDAVCEPAESPVRHALEIAATKRFLELDLARRAAAASGSEASSAQQPRAWLSLPAAGLRLLPHSTVTPLRGAASWCALFIALLTRRIARFWCNFAHRAVTA